MKKIIGLIFALFVASAAWAESAGLEISDLRSVNIASGVSEITGIATNQTGRAIKTAFIDFKLYDRHGNIVGNTATYTRNIQPGERWKFRAMATEEFATAKVVEVRLFDN